MSARAAFERARGVWSSVTVGCAVLSRAAAAVLAAVLLAVLAAGPARAADPVDLGAIDGRRLLLWEAPQSGVIRVEVAFPDGPAREGWPDVGTLYWRALPWCVGGHSVETWVGWDSVHASITTTSKRLDAAVAQLQKTFEERWTCPTVDVAPEQGRRLDAWLEEPAFRLAAVAARHLLAPDDRRRAFGDTTLATIADAYEAESLRDRVVRRTGAVVSVAGACDAACARGVVAALFPRPPATPVPALAAPRAPVPPPAGPVRETLRGLPQVHVGVARLAPALGDPDVAAFLALDEVLDLRLEARLRGTLGRVYAVIGSAAPSPWPSVWVRCTMVRPDGAELVATTFRETLAALAGGGLTEAELAVARRRLDTRRHPDDVAARLALFAAPHVPGVAPLDRALAAGSTVSREAVSKFAARFFAAGEVLEVRLEPEG